MAKNENDVQAPKPMSRVQKLVKNLGQKYNALNSNAALYIIGGYFSAMAALGYTLKENFDTRQTVVKSSLENSLADPNVVEASVISNDYTGGKY